MYEKGRVITVEKSGRVLILPFESDGCLGCTKEVCSQLGKNFWVDNSLNLKVEPGQIVKISVEKKVQVQQGFFALGRPIVGALLGWFLAKRFYFDMKFRQAPESVLVVSVILGFTVFALLAVLIRNFFQNAQLPKITEILDSQS